MFRRIFTSTVALTTVLALAACTSPSSPDEEAKDPQSAAPAPVPSVEVQGSAKAGDFLKLSVTDGEFASVELTSADNKGVGTDTGAFKAATGSAAKSTDGASQAATDAATDDANAGGITESKSGSSGNSGESPANTAESGEPAASESAADSSAGDTSAAADDPAAGPQGGARDLSPKGTDWTSHYQLAGDEEYEWTATVIDANGESHTETGTVETGDAAGAPSRTSTVIGDDAVVGVGAPIILIFSGKVDEKYRGAVENRLSVTTTDENGKDVEVEGSWGWLFDTDGHSRIHYRTKEFWPEHTKVKVSAPLEGVQLTKNTYGAKDLNLSFEIGREQMVIADAKKHTMVVKQGDKVVNEYPASLGSPQAPSSNGMHVVMSKADSYTMTSERWGYSTPVRYAVRLHNNGEFIHAAPWSVGSQGRANVSHGCVNLSTENASEYFKTAIYGDPVEIKGSSVNLSKKDSDISDWVYDWDEWQELSALAKS